MKLKSGEILKSIKEKAKKIKRKVIFMELCGTHSQSVAKYGIKNILPKNIKLLSGPGCPVCVLDQKDIDVIVGLALAGIPVAVYGDSVNVPGNLMSLDSARQKGADVNIIYDAGQALKLRKEKPNIVFWGIGFETTTPMTAWAIKKGLNVFSSHKLFPPAMEALLAEKDLKIDGFINPGHVSAIIGTEIYKKFKVPQVIAGFMERDVLLAIDMLLKQILNKEAKVENEYARVVKKNGNKKAVNLTQEVFETGDASWRGLGIIKNSGLKIKKKYKNQDAEFIHQTLIAKIRKNIKPRHNACQCGLILKGVKEPNECPLFNKICNPDNPQGACMVSVEGACHIEYNLRKK